MANTFEQLKKSVDLAVSIPLDESTTGISTLEENLTNYSIQANALLAEDATLKDVVGSLQKSIARKTKAIEEFKESLNSDTAEAEETEELDEATDDNAETETSVDDAMKLIEQAADYIETLEVQLSAEKKISESLMQKLAESEQENKALTETVASQAEIIACSTEQVDDTMETAVEEAIAANPGLAEVRTLLEKCSTVEELNTVATQLAKVPARIREDRNLPPINEKLNSGTSVKVAETSTKTVQPLSESASDGAKMVARMTARLRS